MDGHSKALFAKSLQGKELIKARDLPKYQGHRVRLASCLITIKTVFTNKREPMQLLIFKNKAGLVEAAFFP